MRLMAGLFALFLSLALPAAAQEAAGRGPYLTGSSGERSLVLVALGDAAPGAILTYGVIDNQVHRMETVLEIDCAAVRYRTGRVQIYRSDVAGERAGLVIDIAGMDWRPLGPQDTVIRDYFCSGQITGEVHPTVQPAFSDWMNRYGG